MKETQTITSAEKEFEEIKPVLKKILDFLSACKEPEKYLYGGKLNLRNFYVSFFTLSCEPTEPSF